HVLTDDDIWAFQTNLQMLKTLPPVEYDHPYAGDLYILDGKSRCTTDINIACAEPHDTWCLISYQKEQVIRWSWTINLVIKHEIAHCNGWSGHHEGARLYEAGTTGPAAFADRARRALAQDRIVPDRRRGRRL